MPHDVPFGSRGVVRHRPDRVRPPTAPTGRGPRTSRGVYAALAVSALSVLVATAATLVALHRPDTTPRAPAPLTPATVTVTLLAPPR